MPISKILGLFGALLGGDRQQQGDSPYRGLQGFRALSSVLAALPSPLPLDPLGLTELALW